MTRALSIDDLPYVNGGVLGMWLIQLRDAINSHHAGVAWEGGKSMQPVTGALLKRFVAASNNVIGALRVDGDPCELGDCSTLKPPEPIEQVEDSTKSKKKQSAKKLKKSDSDPPPASDAQIEAEHDALVVSLLTEGGVGSEADSKAAEDAEFEALLAEEAEKAAGDGGDRK